MLKPNWKDAPEWADWLVQDKNKDWYWYEYLPECRDGIWYSYLYGNYEKAELLYEAALKIESKPDNKTVNYQTYIIDNNTFLPYNRRFLS
jgi:hypothetical protein